MLRTKTEHRYSARRKPERHSMALPTMSCKTASCGTHRKMWLESSSKDKPSYQQLFIPTSCRENAFFFSQQDFSDSFLCTIQLLFVILQPLIR